MKDTCIFCGIISGAVPAEKVYEDASVIAFLDIHPIRPGHVLLVPKLHSVNVLDASPDSLMACARVLPKLVGAVIAATQSTGCNVGINNGASAGQVVEHLHIHLIPRIEGDGLISWGHTEAEDLGVVAKSIRAAIGN